MVPSSMLSVGPIIWRWGVNSGDNSRGPAIPIFLFIISSLRSIPSGKVIDHCDDQSKATQFLGLVDSLDHLLNLAYSIADDRHAIKKALLAHMEHFYLVTGL